MSTLSMLEEELNLMYATRLILQTAISSQSESIKYNAAKINALAKQNKKIKEHRTQTGISASALGQRISIMKRKITIEKKKATK